MMSKSLFSLKGKLSTFMVFLVIAVLLVLLPGDLAAGKKSPLKIPETRMGDVREILHGVEIYDPYRWLEDQESKDTRAWIEAQNEYTHSFIDRFDGREKLVGRITELMKIDRIGIPRERNGIYFLTKRSADQQQHVIYMRKGINGRDEVLIDPHGLSEDRSTSVNILDLSKDGKMLVYGLREGGEDELTVKFFDVEEREDMEEVLPKGNYFGISVTPDMKGLYYSRYTTEIGSRIYYHEFGRDLSSDVEIFGEGFGPGVGIGGEVTDDGKYLLISVYYGSSGSKTEVYLQNLAEGGPIVPIVNDIEASFIPSVGGDILFMQTTWEAPNKRIFAVELDNPDRARWKEIIPETAGVIENFSLAGGRIFVQYLENVVSKVKVFDSKGSYLRDVPLPAIGSVGGMSGRWKSDEAFYIFNSFHVPTTIYRYEVKKGNQEVWAKLDVPLDSGIFDVSQVWFESKDGTRVPMFMVHRKDIELDGNNPVILTGYGGFTVNMTPYFTSRAVLWVESGGIYAMPSLRGGGEFGEKWHKAGMLENKQNTFDDFIAAAEWLIEKGYTNKSKLIIRGGSNGGLLVGAAMVQRPDLFKAVVCTYPLLDMIRYHKFLIAKFWVPEYGSSEDPEQFSYIYDYSPYHNVKKDVSYPATLFITGDADTRVAPLHARKMAAMLQAANASDNPILLLYDTKAGHSGGRPLGKQIEDLADEMSFNFWQMGMKVN